jgi:DNA-directed RNA polymerase specialized sigma24 family protein
MPTIAPEITPDQAFEVIYRDHSRQITTYIATRLYRTDRHLAEDLTAEAFTRLWRSILAGLQVKHPRALLTVMADRSIADHFRRRSSTEQAIDFADPATPHPAAGRADQPHLARLLAELEDAKEHLALAADAYRAINRQ